MPNPTPAHRPTVDPLERRVLLDATVRTVSLANDPAYPTTPATDVAADAYGTVYATRVGGDGTDHTQLVVVPAGGTAPQLLTSFAPMIEYAGTTETPYGQLIVDAAGDVFGVTRFTAAAGADAPLDQDYTQGTLWELPAHFNVVDVLARFYKPQTAPRSLTIDAAGNLYGVVDSLLGQGSSLFEYPADETGTVTVPLGVGQTCTAVVADPAGNVFGVLTSTDDPTGPFTVFEVRHGNAFATPLAAVPAALGHDVAGLALDAAGDLFVTTRQGTGGGAILELPAGASAARLLAGVSGQTFTGRPAVDPAGNVFATADDAAGTTSLVKLPAGGGGLQFVASFPTGHPTDVSVDALGVLHGTYADTATGQATVYAVSGKTTPNPTPVAPPVAVAAGLAPMVARSNMPAARTVTVSLTNTGTTAETGMATVAVYATPAGSPAAAGVRLASVARKVRLAPGGGTTWAMRVPPATLLAGTYTLLAVATDPAGTALASTAGPTLTVAHAALAATVAATLAAGGWVVLTATVTNAGPAASTGPLSATFALSTNGTPLGTTVRRVTVRPGVPVVLRVRLRLPAGTPGGRYQPTVTVTQGNATATAVAATPVTVG